MDTKRSGIHPLAEARGLLPDGDKIENLLLCVGAQKAGTTWLAEILKRDQNFSFSPYKEIHYFDYCQGLNDQLPKTLLSNLASAVMLDSINFGKIFFRNDECSNDFFKLLINDDWYKKQFLPHKKYSADFTPIYALLSGSEFEHIKEVSNNQKIIFIMREPVSRTFSAIQYFYQNRGIEVSSIPDDVLLKKIKTPLFYDRSNYSDTIKKLNNEFKSQDILYLFYEDMMENKNKTLERIYKFLGLELSVLTGLDLERKINSSKKVIFSKQVIDGAREIFFPIKQDVKALIGRVPTSWEV